MKISFPRAVSNFTICKIVFQNKNFSIFVKLVKQPMTAEWIVTFSKWGFSEKETRSSSYSLTDARGRKGRAPRAQFFLFHTDSTEWVLILLRPKVQFQTVRKCYVNEQGSFLDVLHHFSFSSCCGIYSALNSGHLNIFQAFLSNNSLLFNSQFVKWCLNRVLSFFILD